MLFTVATGRHGTVVGGRDVIFHDNVEPHQLGISFPGPATTHRAPARGIHPQQPVRRRGAERWGGMGGSLPDPRRRGGPAHRPQHGLPPGNIITGSGRPTPVPLSRQPRLPESYGSSATARVPARPLRTCFPGPCFAGTSVGPRRRLIRRQLLPAGGDPQIGFVNRAEGDIACRHSSPYRAGRPTARTWGSTWAAWARAGSDGERQ
jgi:hypothetical protein